MSFKCSYVWERVEITRWQVWVIWQVWQHWKVQALSWILVVALVWALPFCWSQSRNCTHLCAQGQVWWRTICPHKILHRTRHRTLHRIHHKTLHRTRHRTLHRTHFILIFLMWLKIYKKYYNRDKNLSVPPVHLCNLFVLCNCSWLSCSSIQIYCN